MIFAVISVVSAVILSVVVGVIAETKGRAGIGWFFISLIITPVMALLCLIALEVGTTTNTTATNEDISVKRECPHCLSMIDKRATVCAVCTRDVPQYVEDELSQSKDAALNSLDDILAHWDNCWEFANGEFISVYSFIHKQYFSSDDVRYSGLRKKLEGCFSSQDGEALIEVVKQLKQIEATE